VRRGDCEAANRRYLRDTRAHPPAPARYGINADLSAAPAPDGRGGYPLNPMAMAIDINGLPHGMASYPSRYPHLRLGVGSRPTYGESVGEGRGV